MDRVKEFFRAINQTFEPVDVNGSLLPHNLMFVDDGFTIMIYRLVGDRVLGYPIRLTDEDFEGWRVDEMISKIKYAVDEHCIGYNLQIARDANGKLNIVKIDEE